MLFLLASSTCESSSHRSSSGNVEEKILDPNILMDLQFILRRKLREIIRKYGLYVDCLRCLLEERGVTPHALRSYLLSVTAFSGSSDEHMIALISEKKQALKEAQTVTDIVDFLTTECSSFLNYEIFQDIAKKYKIRADREELRYGEHLKAYIKEHKVVEFAMINPLLKNIKEDSKILTLKLDVENTCRLAKVVELKQSIAEALELNPSTLHIVDCREGCVVVTFLIPAAVADVLFKADTKFTPHQMDQFRALSVLWVECNGYTFHLKEDERMEKEDKISM